MEVVGSVVPIVILRLSPSEADDLGKMCDWVEDQDGASKVITNFATNLADALARFERDDGSDFSEEDDEDDLDWDSENDPDN